MKKLTPIVVMAALLFLASAGSALAAGIDTEMLWQKVDTVSESSQRVEAAARTDIRRGLIEAALVRYRVVVGQVDQEIALLEVIYARERDLDRQTAALTRLGMARDRLERAEDIMHILRASTARHR